MWKSKPFATFLSALALAGIVGTESAQAIIVPNTITGRFIRVENNGPATRVLHIGEIEAFGGGILPTAGVDGTNDFALISKGASFEAQSFFDTGSGATHGSVDAPINGALDTGGTTYSRTNASFYMLDLGQNRDMARARVWQRTDSCCQERLADITVSILADNGGGLPGAVVASQSFGSQVPTNSFAQFILAQGNTILPGGDGVIGTETVGLARYIQVVRNTAGTQLLSFGEIEAFALGVAPGPNGNAAGNGSLNNPNDLARSAVGASIFSTTGTITFGAPSTFIDGNEQSGGATPHLTGTNPQVTVKLAADTNLGTIRLHQRNDTCCQDRLSDFTLNIFSDNGSGAPGTLVSTATQVAAAPTAGFSQFSFTPEFTIGANDILKIDVDPSTGMADLFEVGFGGIGLLKIEAGATLVLNFLSPIPNALATYNILDFGSIQGMFTNIIAPKNVDFSRLLIDGTIVTGIPEPTTLGLLVLSGAALLRRRRLA